MKRMVSTSYVVEDFCEDTTSGYGNLAHEKVNPQRAIRLFCLSCQGGHEHPWRTSDGSVEPASRPYDEVKHCKAETCWLWPFRTGRNPYRAAKEMTQEEKTALGVRLALARAKVS